MGGRTHEEIAEHCYQYVAESVITGKGNVHETTGRGGRTRDYNADHRIEYVNPWQR